MTRENTIAIVTVHGTGDTAEGAAGEKWFQQGSGFAQRVLQRLAARGIRADFVPHLWSGENLVTAREKGAESLVRTLKRAAEKHDSVHVIGHSHGGNVANDAAVLMRWGRKPAQNETMDSLITVGTPFLDTRTGFFQVLGGLLFRAITWGSVIAFPVLVAGALLMYFEPDGTDTQDWPVILIALALTVPCLWFMLNMSSRGVRRVLRPRDKKRYKRSLFALWHENDEAIAFLQRVEKLPIEAFPRGAFYRSSRTAAISWGVIAVLLVAFFAPIAYMVGADILALEQFFLTQDQHGLSVENAITISISSLFIAPLVFVGVFLLYRYIIGGASELLARGSMNRWVSGVLRGIALGRDGDQAPCRVATLSHTHPCDHYVLAGDVAARMQAASTQAANALIEKYRWALFTVGEDTNSALSKLATDAMTWDSLIHTTYFEQPEVAEMIADFIAAQVRGETFAPAAATPTAPPPEQPPPPDDAIRAA
jgi:hypothetical protein